MITSWPKLVLTSGDIEGKRLRLREEADVTIPRIPAVVFGFFVRRFIMCKN